MGLVQNLKKTLNAWGDKILVELSCHYIKHLAKQTLKKQDSSSPMGFSLNPLTREDQHTTIATSSADTSEKITMKDSTELVNHIREWAIDKIEEYNGKGIERVYDQMAILDEFDEWLEPDEDLEVVIIDEISEEEYDAFTEGIERG
jgi:hypothetical protein